MSVLSAAQLRSNSDLNCENSNDDIICDANIAEISLRNKRLELPKKYSFDTPCCSRCKRKTETVKGATFINEDKNAIKTTCFKLWQCDYCNNYEITKSSFALFLKRFVGKRVGSSVNFNIDRRPTFTRHGKISFSSKKDSYACYIPVKAYM